MGIGERGRRAGASLEILKEVILRCKTEDERQRRQNISEKGSADLDPATDAAGDLLRTHRQWFHPCSEPAGQQSGTFLICEFV